MIAERFARIGYWFQDAAFRRLFLNASKLLSANCLSALIGLVAAALSAWTLGPEKYGIMALLLAYRLTISTLTALNPWPAIIKFGSEAIQSDDRAGLRQLVRLGFILDVSSALVGMALALVLSGPTAALLQWDPDLQKFLLLYSLLILFSMKGTPVGILRLFDRFDFLSYSTILNSLGQLVGVTYCVLFAPSLLSFVVAHLLAGLFSQTFLLVASAWVVGWQERVALLGQPLSGLRTRFPGIVHYVFTTYLNRMVNMVSREVDELIIAGLMGAAPLGLYKVAKKFSRGFSMLTEPLYQSIFPEMSRAWTSTRPRQLWTMVKRSTFFVSVPAVVVWVAFVAFGRWAIPAFVGSEYSGAYLPAVLYMLGLVVATITFCLQPLMLATGRTTQSVLAISAATAVYVGMLIPLTFMFGIAGAAASYVVYYFVWAAIAAMMLIDLPMGQVNIGVATNERSA